MSFIAQVFKFVPLVFSAIVFVSSSFAENGLSGKKQISSSPKDAEEAAAICPASMPASLTREERIFGLVKIYATAKQHFAYFENLPSLNWDQSFMTFLPQVEKDQDLLSYYRVLQRFIALLQDGHTNVSLPSTIYDRLDTLPFRLDFIKKQWIVVERYPTDDILKEDVPPGSVLFEIEGLSPSKYFEANIFPYISVKNEVAKRSSLNEFKAFPKNKKIHLVFQYPDQSIHPRLIYAKGFNGIKWTKPLYEKYLLPWHRFPDFETKMLDGSILYVRYKQCNSFCEKKFSELFETMKLPSQAKAIILDLRGNEGGNTPQETISHLISVPTNFYRYETRWTLSCLDAQRSLNPQKGYSMGWYRDEYVFLPHKNHYAGPLFILTDGDTGSAAEDLVVVMQENNRAKVIGTQTFGSTGQPFSADLPGGGKFRVCTVRSSYSDGRPFVGCGIQPDIPVFHTKEAFIQGRDVTLEVALKKITVMLSSTLKCSSSR